MSITNLPLVNLACLKKKALLVLIKKTFGAAKYKKQEHGTALDAHDYPMISSHGITALRQLESKQSTKLIQARVRQRRAFKIGICSCVTI